ncbi:MAG: hypothetical protein PWQ91_1414 [Eubacteriales bacterium]|nr:hypothetical protein [Eubacteriales bacterium]
MEEKEIFGESMDGEKKKDPETSKGVFARLWGVLVNPGATFAEIAEAPKTAGAMVFLLAVFLVLTAGGLALAEKTAIGAAMMAPPGMNPGAIKAIVWVSVLIGIPVSLLVGWLILSAFYKLLLTLTGEEILFRNVWAVVVYSRVPEVFKGLINVVMVAINPASYGKVLTSPAVFLPSESKGMLYALLSSFDVFTLWACVLAAIGISALGVSRKKAYGIVFAVFLAGVVLSVLVASFMPTGMGPGFAPPAGMTGQ